MNQRFEPYRRHLMLALLVLAALIAEGCSGKDSPTAPTQPTTPRVEIQSFTATGEANPTGSGYAYYTTFSYRETTGTGGVTVTSLTFTLADGRTGSAGNLSTRVAAGATVASGVPSMTDAGGASLSGTLRITANYTTDGGVTGQATATANVTPTTRYVIDGVVRNGATGRALQGVGIALVDSTNKQVSTTSDGNGYYVLRDIAGGRVTLVAVFGGYSNFNTTQTITGSGSININMQEIVAPVEYRITGTARTCAATYANQSGGTNQQTVSIPFSYKWTSARSGDFLYMSCQINQGSDSGSITVDILRSGVRVSTATAFGFPNIATASASY